MASEAPTSNDGAACRSDAQTVPAELPLHSGVELLAACKSSEGAAGGVHRLEAMRLLGIEGVDVNARDWRGKTPLIYAIEKGVEEVALALVAYKGFEVNTKDKYGVTPLHLACRFGAQKELALALVANEAVDVNAKDNNGKTPLDYATQESIIACLLDRGVEHKAYANLHEACKEESTIEAMRLLGIESTPVNALDEDGMTALNIAYIMGLKEVAVALLARPDLDTRTVDPTSKFTPLSKSTSRSHEGIVVDPPLTKYEDPVIVPELKFTPLSKSTSTERLVRPSLRMKPLPLNEDFIGDLESAGDAAAGGEGLSPVALAISSTPSFIAHRRASLDERVLQKVHAQIAPSSPRKAALRAEIAALRAEKAEADAAIAALRAEVAKLNGPESPLRREVATLNVPPVRAVQVHREPLPPLSLPPLRRRHRFKLLKPL